MDTALSICLTLAQTVYERAQTAQYNKRQSKLLGERVVRLMEQLQRMEGMQIRSACVDELQNTLEAAQDLLDSHDKQYVSSSSFAVGPTPCASRRSTRG